MTGTIFTIGSIKITWHTLGQIIVRLIGGSGLIEIIPQIKWNPITWLFNKFEQVLNRQLFEEINGVKDKLSDMDKKISKLESQDKAIKKEAEEREALRARRHILTSADELRRGIKHSKEWFDDILLDVTNYKEYCDDHAGFLNDKARISIKYINDTYENCLKENSFL